MEMQTGRFTAAVHAETVHESFFGSGEEKSGVMTTGM